MQKFLYKICSKSEWNNLKKKGKFKGTKKDILDGYIHLSKKNQVKKTLIKHFLNKNNLFLLKIEASKISNLIWEKSAEGILFPHLYSFLSLKYIKNCHIIKLNKNGFHKLPLFF
jgi:uncharacterized protein (DUF952 family)